MHKFVLFNRQIIPAANSFLPAISAAAFYGRGIFTTVAIYDSKPFQWEKHWQRLTENAQKIGVDLSEFSAETIKNSLLEIVSVNKVTDARSRLTFFDETSGKIWETESKRKTNFLIVTADFQPLGDFSLTVSPFRANSTSPLAGVKSCNYLENVLVLEDAWAKKFDEAVRLNERSEVVSVAMANVFWTKNGEIFTPAVETGCLKGTTRSFVLENFPVRETKAELMKLNEADEIFLTSAGIGIAPVKIFDRKTLTGEITKNIKEKFLRCRHL